MGKWIAALSLSFAALPARGAEILRSITTEERKIEGTGVPRTIELAAVESPSIRRAVYAIRGTVRHEAVVGRAYFEMWSVFPGVGRFFTRGVAEAGPLRALTGSSPSRPFVLPFSNREGAPPPARLEVNLVVPGEGTVHVGPLELVEFDPGEDPLGLTGAWWGERAAGILGAISGGLVGLLGALLAWLVTRGRARRFVFGALATLVTVGVATFAAGVLAVLLHQPYAVYYPLLLIGAMDALLPLVAWRTARHRYEEHEMRRMQALDAI
jgi:hypothetical protein